MAVQILNEMPDAEVHRGDPLGTFLRDLNSPRPSKRLNGRAVFLAFTIGLHALLALALIRMQFANSALEQPQAIEAALLEAPADNEPPPPTYTPPPMNVVYSLPTPQDITIETEAISEMQGTAITSPGPVTTVAPPLVESVEYVRAAPPVYPKESARKKEYGTVILRILVDEAGRPAQIQIEQSSGYDRLDAAARKAAEKFLFRPHEVNGIKQAAQVRIPIGFDPPSRS